MASHARPVLNTPPDSLPGLINYWIIMVNGMIIINQSLQQLQSSRSWHLFQMSQGGSADSFTTFIVVHFIPYAFYKGLFLIHDT